MKRKLDEDHYQKQQLIRAGMRAIQPNTKHVVEAEKHANIVKAQTEQELASKAAELQIAAMKQAQILKDKENQLKAQEEALAEQMRILQERRQKEMQLAAKEQELLRQVRVDLKLTHEIRPRSSRRKRRNKKRR